MKIAFLGLAAFIIYRVATFAYGYGYRIFAEEPVDREPGIDVNVAIVEGKSVKEIGKLLEEKGLIRDGFLFILQEKFSEYSGDLKPGVYTLNTSQTPYEMLAIMSQEAEESQVDETSSEKEEDEPEGDLSEENPEGEDNPAAQNTEGAGEGQQN